MEQKTKSILELIEENVVDGRLNEFRTGADGAFSIAG